MTPADLIAKLDRIGIHLSLERGVLLARPRNKLTDDIRQTIRQHRPALLAFLADEDAREHIEERAALAEYDGGLPRIQAERQAAERVFSYQLADDPMRWLVMLAKPGDTLETVTRTLQNQFGKHRVLRVCRYHDEDMRASA